MNPKSTHDWLKLLLLLCVVGMGRAGMHLLKIMMLGLMGLAGMWMLHKLAQDYNAIRKGVTAAKAILRLKRDTTAQDAAPALAYFSSNQSSSAAVLDWSPETILRLDPKECVRSFVCQSAAMLTSEKNLEQFTILKLIKTLTVKDDWASEQLRQAVGLGAHMQDIQVCRRKFRKCPFTIQAMLTLMNALS